LDIFFEKKNVGIETFFYATGWFLTLYTAFLPFNLVLRIIDIFFFEKFKILYRVGLAILKCKEKEILEAKNMEKVIKIVKDNS